MCYANVTPVNRELTESSQCNTLLDCLTGKMWLAKPISLYSAVSSMIRAWYMEAASAASDITATRWQYQSFPAAQLSKC